MRPLLFIIVLAVSALATPTSARAQLHAEGPVVNGHHHFNAGDVDEHVRFWVDRKSVV